MSVTSIGSGWVQRTNRATTDAVGEVLALHKGAFAAPICRSEEVATTRLDSPPALTHRYKVAREIWRVFKISGMVSTRSR
jgi:hypothetical protein